MRGRPGATDPVGDITALLAARDAALSNVYARLRPVLDAMADAFNVRDVFLDEVYEEQGMMIFFITVRFAPTVPVQWCVTMPVDMVDTPVAEAIRDHVRRNAGAILQHQ
jgi:hypothetical protein